MASNARNMSRRSHLPRGSCYTQTMMDELEFRRLVESSLADLKQHLIAREEEEE